MVTILLGENKIHKFRKACELSGNIKNTWIDANYLRLYNRLDNVSKETKCIIIYNCSGKADIKSFLVGDRLLLNPKNEPVCEIDMPEIIVLPNKIEQSVLVHQGVRVLDCDLLYN